MNVYVDIFWCTVFDSLDCMAHALSDVYNWKYLLMLG